MLDASLSQPARIGRWLYYQAVKHLPIGGPRIVSEGDSWFQHPTELEIIDWLIGHPEGYKIRSLGHAGAWLKEMLEDAEFVDAIREERPKVFLFSGGGNDVLEGFLYSILRESDEFETAQECLDEDSLAHHFDRLEDQFGKVYDMAQKAAGGSIPMIVHGYDYPNPGKKYYGILDWGLGKTLEHRGVQERLWYDVVKLIIDRFNIMLQELAKHRDHIYYVDLRKTLDKTDFVDETHPTSYAARKLAEKIHVAIQKVL